MSYRVAILISCVKFTTPTIFSDTAAADHQLDKSGPLIRQRLASASCYNIVNSTIVPDDKDAISLSVLTSVHQQKAALILTTGGTGFGPRDVTPEAVSPLFQKHAPGIQHLLLSTSLKHTPLAALSRLVAGTLSNSLIITLPGSPKAVQECLDCLLENGVLEHALQLITGTDSRKLHDESSSTPMEYEQKPGGSHDQHRHTHSHKHHGHNAPTPKSSVSQRPRHSPYPIISLAEAYNLILANLTPLPAEIKKVDSSLRGHVLAEPIIATHNIPSLPSSNVDGYALKSSYQSGTYGVLHSANHPLDEDVPPDCIYRINTGAPLPRGTDAVIMVEDTTLVSEFTNTASLGEERQVQTLVSVDAGENIRQPGSDVRQGDKIFDLGDALGNTGGDIGALAFIGRKEVHVFRKPVVAIMSTGDEMCDLHDNKAEEADWRGWDTNRPTLKTVLEALGYVVIDLGIVKDNIDAHVKAFQDAFARADILVSAGGSSMGTSDFMKPVIEEKLRGMIRFGRVKVKPGKPTIFAQIPSGDGTLKPVFALPGNPASALTTFYLFVLPALRLMGGYAKEKCQLPRIKAELAEPMALDPRPEFHRAHIRPDSEGKLLAYSTGGQRSSRAISLSRANALIALPSKEQDGRVELVTGGLAEAILIDF